MNMRVRSLLITAALTLPVLITATATAGPDCTAKKFADHHLCPTTPTSTTTSIPDLGSSCAESVAEPVQDGHQVFSETDGFSIVVDPGRIGCVDWTTTIESNWLVTVDPGIANSVRFNVRGSHPGDFCWLDALGAKDIKSGLNTLNITHSNGPLADGDGRLPVSSVGACGDWDDNAASFVLTVDPSGKPSPVIVSVTATG